MKFTKMSETIRKVYLFCSTKFNLQSYFTIKQSIFILRAATDQITFFFYKIWKATHKFLHSVLRGLSKNVWNFFD